MSFGYREIVIYGVFTSLIIFSLLTPRILDFYRTKKISEWVIDLSNLILQGTIIPMIQIGGFFSLMSVLFPDYKGSLQLGFFGGLLINLFLVDYLYYWNHRLLHHKKLFFIHLVHHTVKEFDVFATSKNTIWTSFCLVYLPVGGLFLFLLDDPNGYLLGVAISGSLDLWKHSKLSFKSNLLSKYFLLVTPSEHSYHHGKGLQKNFGANFNIWDKFHGTYEQRSDFEEYMGVNANMNFWNKFLFPLRRK